MEQPAGKTARPRHTSVIAGLIIGGSTLAVLGVADQLVGLHSLQTRQALEDFLRRSDVGMGLDQARSLLRVLLMVVAGCATAAAVLGFGVLRRDHRSRLALTVLAVPLFVGGLVTGGLFTSVVASAVVFLWLGPSGDWFAGRSPQPRPGSGARAQSEPPMEAPPPPPSYAPPSSPAAAPPPDWQQPPSYRPMMPTLPPLMRRRPGSILTACALTWGLSGLVIGLLSLTLAAVIASPDSLWREALRQQPQLAAEGLTQDDLFTVVTVLGVVGILWAGVAAVLAALVFRGSNGARLALVISGFAAATVCLVGTLASPVLLVPVLVCAAGASLLLRPESRAWCQPGRR